MNSAIKFICLIIIFLGMFVAGYLLLIELVIECIFIVVALRLSLTPLSLSEVEYIRIDSNLITSAFNIKGKGLKRFLKGDSSLYLFSIIFSGVLIGCCLTLFTKLFHDWSYLVTRETKEIILDVVTFSPLFLLLKILAKKYKELELTRNFNSWFESMPAEDSAYQQKWFGDLKLKTEELNDMIGDFLAELQLYILLGLVGFVFGIFSYHYFSIEILNEFREWKIQI